jgi:hypothetical protein
MLSLAHPGALGAFDELRVFALLTLPERSELDEQRLFW